MSAETDFRTVLTSAAGVTALVPAVRISQNAVDQDADLPYIAFTSRHAPVHGLANNVLATEVTFAVQCWGATSTEADAVAAIDAAVHRHRFGRTVEPWEGGEVR
jgi:hypothetical protein